MARKRKPKFSNFKAADWDKYIKVKKGEDKYKVDRPAPAEDKQLYSCGIIPFGVTPQATPHRTTWVSLAGVKMAKSVLGSTYQNILGMEADSANSTDAPAGWYPAVMTISLVGTADKGSVKTSQLSTREYKKKSTRSGSFPFGRRTIATKDSQTGAATTGVADVDYSDSLKEIKEAFLPEPASPASAKIASKSSQPELWVPVVGVSQWLSALDTVPDVTGF